MSRFDFSPYVTYEKLSKVIEDIDLIMIKGTSMDPSGYGPPYRDPWNIIIRDKNSDTYKILETHHGIELGDHQRLHRKLVFFKMKKMASILGIDNDWNHIPDSDHLYDKLKHSYEAMHAIESLGTSMNGTGYGPPYGAPWFIIDVRGADFETGHPGDLIEEVDTDDQIESRLHHHKILAMANILGVELESEPSSGYGR